MEISVNVGSLLVAWVALIAFHLVVTGIRVIRGRQEKAKRVIRNVMDLSGLVFISLPIFAFAHEIGHAITGMALGITVLKIEIHGFGGFTRLTQPLDSIPPLGAIAIAIAGPTVNFVIGMIAVSARRIPALSKFSRNMLNQACVLNISFAWFNMMPIVGADGGAILGGLSRLLASSPQEATVVAIILTPVLFLMFLWGSMKIGPLVMDES